MTGTVKGYHLFPPHPNMTPEEALAYASKEEWEKVLIIGYQTDDEGVFMRSSHMTREQALWLIEWAKRQALGDI